MELVEDLVSRLGETDVGRVLYPLWTRPILKRDVVGIHGTLFYDNEHRHYFFPTDEAGGRLARRIGKSPSARTFLSSPGLTDFDNISVVASYHLASCLRTCMR